MSLEQMSLDIRGDIRYEVILLGPNVSVWRADLTRELRGLFEERMLDPDAYLSIRTSADFDPIDDGDVRVGVWMGAAVGTNDPTDLAILQEFIDIQIPVFPVVDSTNDYRSKVPSELHPINGLAWSAATLGAELMAAFRLTRSVRRAFVSYRRSESIAIAVQLFEELSKKGYEVFLDTASVAPAVDFQNSLWCRMSNVDLIIFLDSPKALDSEWVHHELARALDLGLGVLQLVWPNHEPFDGTGFCDRFQINENDFEPTPPSLGSVLTDKCMQSILQASERSRIRSLTRRRRRLSDTVYMAANSLHIDVSMHPVCAFELRKNSQIVGHLLPHIGLPDAPSIQEHETETTRNRCRQKLDKYPLAILFDGLGMDEAWDKHLQWMNARNPIPVRNATQLLDWMKGI